MRLELKHATVRYPEGIALSDVTLSITQGSFVAVMGATGSGKTTLLEALAGLVSLSEGSVTPTGFSHQVGIVLQRPEDQLFAPTVFQDVGFALEHLALSREEKYQRITDALRRIGFSDGQASPFSLSGGEKRNVAVAGVLVFHPKVLLLDEPTSSLDPMARASLLSVFRTLHQQGATIVMATHDADAVAECATRLLVMHQGAIVRDGIPEQLFSDIPDMRRWQVGVSQARNLAALLEANGKQLSSEIITDHQLYSALGGPSCRP